MKITNSLFNTFVVLMFLVASLSSPTAAEGNTLGVEDGDRTLKRGNRDGGGRGGRGRGRGRGARGACKHCKDKEGAEHKACRQDCRETVVKPCKEQCKEKETREEKKACYKSCAGVNAN